MLNNSYEFIPTLFNVIALVARNFSNQLSSIQTYDLSCLAVTDSSGVIGDSTEFSFSDITSVFYEVANGANDFAASIFGQDVVNAAFTAAVNIALAEAGIPPLAVQVCLNCILKSNAAPYPTAILTTCSLLTAVLLASTLFI